MPTTPQKICEQLQPGFALCYPGWRLIPDDYAAAGDPRGGILATDGKREVVFMAAKFVRDYVRCPEGYRLRSQNPPAPR